MADFDTLSSALRGEVMTDIASNFFGARIAIDDERALFEFVESDIRLSEQRALNICGQLQALLTSREDLENMLRAIGVSPEFVSRIEETDPWLNMPVPFALTTEGRYKKCVLETYTRMMNAFDFFLHGITYRKNTAEKYGKTTGYYRYLEWCDELNERIKKVNRDHSPTQVLSVVREMDVEKTAKQRAVGTVNSEAGCIPGDDLCILLLPREELQEMELPELPDLETTLASGETVAETIKRYAAAVYKREPEKVKQIIRILKQN